MSGMVKEIRMDADFHLDQSKVTGESIMVKHPEKMFDFVGDLLGSDPAEAFLVGGMMIRHFCC